MTTTDQDDDDAGHFIDTMNDAIGFDSTWNIERYVVNRVNLRKIDVIHWLYIRV